MSETISRRREKFPSRRPLKHRIVPDALYSVEETAELLGVTADDVLEISDDALVATWVGPKRGYKTFLGSDVIAFRRAHPKPPYPPRDTLPIDKPAWDAHEIPIFDSPGIYLLYFDEELVYVGQAVSPLARIGQHVGKKVFERAFYFPVPREELDVVEGALIRRFRPPLNTDKWAPGDPTKDYPAIQKYCPWIMP